VTTLREVAKLALESLRGYRRELDCSQPCDAERALEAELAQQEQEPVAWIQSTHLQQAQRAPFLCRVEPTQRLPDFVPLHTHPPRREWQSLTNEEIYPLYNEPRSDAEMLEFARAVEAKLKEKNHDVL